VESYPQVLFKIWIVLAVRIYSRLEFIAI